MTSLVPFNSTNKWALVIVRPDDTLHISTNLLLQLNKPHSTGKLTSYIKGAPERVLAKCSTYLKDGQTHPITDDFRTAYDNAYDVCPPFFLPFPAFSPVS